MQSLSTVILEPKKIKSVTVSTRGPATSTGSLASQRHPGKFPNSFADLALVHRNPGCMRRGRAPWATLGTGWSLAAPFIQSLWTPLPEPLAGVRPEGRDPKNIWVYDRNIFFYGRSISPHSRRGPFYPAFSGGLSSHFIPQTKKTGTFGLKPVRMREWATSWASQVVQW